MHMINFSENEKKTISLFFKQEYKEIADKIRRFYFPLDGKMNKNSISSVVNLVSDDWFDYAVYRAAKFQAKQSTGKTFFYRYKV